MEILSKLDSVMFRIFQEFFSEKKILFIINCQPVHLTEERFMVIYKIFFADTKYFKIFFIFSPEGEFNGISINNTSRIIEPGVIKKYLKNLIENEIKNGYLGIEIEKDFMKFLPFFKANNRCCLRFANVTCEPEYDPFGIDFQIDFIYGRMPLQLKGISHADDQVRIAEKHLHFYPDIPVFFTKLGEKYERRRARLLKLKNMYFTETRPFVSFMNPF
jgi:hypothetical protein